MSSEDNLPEADANRFITVKEFAARIGVSGRTVWRMIADGELQASRFRRCTRLSLAQLAAYLKGNGGSKVL